MAVTTKKSPPMEKAKPRKAKGNYEGKIAGLYDLEETIGRGHFAVVKLARHVFTGEKVAVKVIDKNKLDEVSRAHLFQEVRCMKLVQHPNVVRLYEVIDTQTKLYLILELGDGGDMYDYIMKHDKGLDEELAKRYFKQIVQAINYCHKLHVVHRDLKPENVVFFEKLGIVKLTDFGFSNKFIPGRQLETSCGSLAYSAPEILLGDAYDAPAVDVWSLGVILFMLVCGEAPFQEANDSETLTMIMDCKYRLPPHISSACTDLIGRMLVRDPANRALLEEIMVHQWLKTGDVAPIPLMPLISRQDISEDDHLSIIQRMVDGKIATKEEILLSLEKNAYDHITATYYLMAERRLKKQREANAMMALNKQNSDSSDNKPALAPLALSPRVQSAEAAHVERQRAQQINSLVSPPGNSVPYSLPALTPQSPSPTLPRRCSLIQEESIDEDIAEEEMDTMVFVSHKSRSVEECLSDDSDTHSSAERSPSRARPPRRTQTVRPLHSVRSSPQLLNQIFEECESEDDGLSLTSKKHSSPHLCQRNSIASPEVIRKFEHTRKKRITAGSRGTSCSSSDASDTDETDSRKRKEKLKQKFHRRDSSDHSSDTDGPSGFGPGGSGRTLGGAGSSRDAKSGKSDRSSHNSKGGNDENKHSSKSRERRQSGGKPQENGGQNLSKKISDNFGSDLDRKISSVSASSSLSNQSSAGSLTSRSSKYLVEASSNTLMPTPTSSRNRDIASMNEENKARSRIIHVRSKDFSDLMDRFKTKDDQGHVPSRDLQHVKFRRRPKDKLKTDINRNGLIAHADGELTDLEAREQNSLAQNTVKTKCCSLV